jgi:hypothetical protein
MDIPPHLPGKLWLAAYFIRVLQRQHYEVPQLPES